MPVQTAPAPPTAPSVTVPSERLRALDVFRGATILGMILVNNPGTWAHIYPPLRHAAWHGWTPTDLIFPFFLFIVGVAIPLAYAKRLRKGIPEGTLVIKATKRAAILFGLGLFMAAYPFVTFEPTIALRDLGTLRIMGVLQRIAVCYLLASLFYLYTSPRTWMGATAAILLGYWALLALVPVPGFGAGQLDVPEGTLAAYLDRMLLGTGHLWVGANREWDPEGLLSTLPALATTLFGVWTGQLVRNTTVPLILRVTRLFAAGVVLVMLGYVWDWVFPINKALWTSSYAVFTAGQAMCGLALCLWLIDVRGQRGWTQPFVVYGMNALIVFVMSGLLAKTLIYAKVRGADGDLVSLQSWIFQSVFLPLASPINASLLYALAWIVLWYLVLWWMYRKRIFVKV